MAVSNFTTEQIITAATIFGTACTAFGLFVTAITNALKEKWAKRQARENSTVEEKKVRVTEREAENHEVQILFEGFRALNTATAERAATAEASAADAHRRLDEEKAANDQWRREITERLDREARIKDEMIDHIKLLEGGWPTPPGPPTRPNWSIS